MSQEAPSQSQDEQKNIGRNGWDVLMHFSKYILWAVLILFICLVLVYITGGGISIGNFSVQKRQNIDTVMKRDTIYKAFNVSAPPTLPIDTPIHYLAEKNQKKDARPITVAQNQKPDTPILNGARIQHITDNHGLIANGDINLAPPNRKLGPEIKSMLMRHFTDKTRKIQVLVTSSDSESANLATEIMEFLNSQGNKSEKGIAIMNGDNRGADVSLDTLHYKVFVFPAGN